MNRSRGLRWTLAATALALAAPAATAAAGSVMVARASVNMTIEPNGIVDVTEERRIYTPAPYTATVDVSMRKGELFAEPVVIVGGRAFHAGDGRAENTLLVSKEDKGIRIAWRQPAGTHSASVSYRIALRGIAYRDVVDMRLVLWNGGSVRRLDAIVTLPRIPRGRVYIWLDPKSADAKVTTAARRIRVRATDLSRALTLRIAFPRAVLASTAGAVVRPQAGLQSVLSDQRRAPHDRTWLGMGALAAVLAAAALIYLSRRRNS